MHKVFRVLGLILLSLLVIGFGVWGTFALLYTGPFGEVGRLLLAIIFGIFSFATLIGVWYRPVRWRMFGAFGILFSLVLMGQRTLSPSNNRNWQDDVAVSSYVTQDKNLYTFHNIRNFTYRSETDYTPHYYDKTYDIDKLVGVDIIAVYWMGPAVAHVFVSFGFSDGEHLAVSIEIRKEKSEGYSMIKGFFRQYELHYVVADERDVIGLRTNYRFNPVEDVYIYPMAGNLEDARQMFLNYIKEINKLYKSPEFYNTLTTNCTTNIWLNAGKNSENIPFSWKILISGYVPEYLYEHGRLKTEGLSFKALKKRAHVNKRALEVGITKDFSTYIRNFKEDNVSQ